MTKKILSFLLAAALLFTLSACVGGVKDPADPADIPEPQSEPAADTPAPQPVPPAPEPVDYTLFLGRYSDTDTPEGPCYTVHISAADNATGEISFDISYVGINSSPLYSTDTIHAVVKEDLTAAFDWTDSWGNSGTGTLVLHADDPATVEIMVTVVEEAEVNRGTLSTQEQYRSLTKRA